MTALADREFERILIIKPSSPGDIIHALPVLHGLRRRYPRARIAWLVATPFVDLVAADPALDEAVPFDRRRFGRLGRSATASRDFVSFVRDLRARRFDLVIDLQGLFRSGFLAYASGAGVRIGPAETRELSRMFYTHRLRRLDDEAHAVDRAWAAAELLGFADAPREIRMTVTDADRAAARDLLQGAGAAADAAFAVLAPATRWETKCWPAYRYGRVGAALREGFGVPSVVVGGASDRETGERAAAASDGAAVNLCGRTTLRQLAAVVEGAAVVVTADSTPMHMAAALGRPLVALFGPTNPRRTGPYGRGADVLRLELDCSPCYFRRLRQCPHDHRCMKDLVVERVTEAAGRRLALPDAAGRVVRS